MLKKIKKGIGSAWDFYRTAPFAETLTLYSAGNGILNYDDAYSVIIGIIGPVVGVILSGYQLRLKNMLEERIISNHGFSERAFSLTIPKWCDRQTARVVAEKYDCLDDYVRLCEANKEEMKHPWLKHF